MQGTVVAVHSGGLYRVQCDAGHEVLAQLSGRMRRFRIKVVPGDRVTVGVSPYDPVRGIITFLRVTEADLKGGNGPSASALKSNKMMQQRILFQALAIIIVVVMLFAAGRT